MHHQPKNSEVRPTARVDNVPRLFYSIEEACEIFRVSRSTLHRMLNAKKIKSRKLGRRTLILAESVHVIAEAAA